MDVLYCAAECQISALWSCWPFLCKLPLIELETHTDSNPQGSPCKRMNRSPCEHTREHESA